MKPINLQIPFNSSLATLERINDLFKDCSRYAVNEHYVAYRNNVIELYLECEPFLDSEQKKVVSKQFNQILAEKVTVTKDGFIATTELLDNMLSLRRRLYSYLKKNKITYYKKEMLQGLAALRGKYGLSAQEETTEED